MDLRQLFLPSVVVAALGVAACGGGSRTEAPPDPTERPTAPPAWRLDVSDVTYSSAVTLGGTITVDVTISNNGTGANATTEFQFGGLEDYADLIGCTPTCTHSKGLGDTYTVLEGIAPGTTEVYHVEFLAKALGVADWSLSVYDDESFGESVYFGQGSITIDG